MYTTNELLAHPLVSPVMQPTLGGLPPLLIMTGGGEFLRDEQIYLAHKCANPTKYPIADSLMHESAREQLKQFKPTDVQLQVWDDLCHVAPTLSFTRPAKYMYRSVSQFGAWALARAQHADIEILDDDAISVISSSEESDDAEQGQGGESSTPRPKTAGTEQHPTVGKAGDPLPPFKNHMIRQRVSRHGTISALDPASDLPACNMRPEEIGVVKEGPVRKWLETRRQWDNRFSSAHAKVQKRRLKAMVEGYDGFDGETPPPSALAGRRKIATEEQEQKKKKSMGLALWSLWGSKHDEATMIREQEADKEPETKTATTEEGEGARTQADLRTQTKKVAQQGHGIANRSRSRRTVVRDERQTNANDSDVDENTPVAVLLAKKEEKQKQAEAEAETGAEAEASTGAGSAEEQASGSGLLGPTEPDTGVTGKRPKVSGIAVPFTLNREAETASMITLTSAADHPSRVVSPIPTSPRTPMTPSPLAIDASEETMTQWAEGAWERAEAAASSSSGGDAQEPAAVPYITVGDDAATGAGAGAATPRPHMETFVTAQEDLPRVTK